MEGKMKKNCKVIIALLLVLSLVMVGCGAKQNQDVPADSQGTGETKGERDRKSVV